MGQPRRRLATEDDDCPHSPTHRHAGIGLGDVDDRGVELLLREVRVAQDEARERHRQHTDADLSHFRKVSSHTADRFEEDINRSCSLRTTAQEFTSRTAGLGRCGQKSVTEKLQSTRKLLGRGGRAIILI